MEIVSNQPLAFTCVVCGQPLPLFLPDNPLSEKTICSSCGHLVCPEHFRKSSKLCTRCAQTQDGWGRDPFKL